MTTMVDEVSPAILAWAADRTLEMHTELASESHPWAGRCSACGPKGCAQLDWAIGYLESLLPRTLSGSLSRSAVTADRTD